MEFKVSLKTDVGRKRSQNQDAAAVYPELGLFIVSDGMGGHKGGEIASATAVKEIQKSVLSDLAQNEWTADTTIRKAIEHANHSIFEYAKTHPELNGMGTTTTALLFQDETLTIGHVGDSRCYFIRPEAVWQLTRDHSLVQEKMRAGLITREEAKVDRMKNVITRSVGYEPMVKVEVFRARVQRGDCFLVCSDGLSGLVDEATVLKIIQKELFENDTIDKAAEILVAAANERGGDDNITALLVQIL